MFYTCALCRQVFSGCKEFSDGTCRIGDVKFYQEMSPAEGEGESQEGQGQNHLMVSFHLEASGTVSEDMLETGLETHAEAFGLDFEVVNFEMVESMKPGT